MHSRARLTVLGALILLVIAGSILSWALENKIIEATSSNQVEVNFSDGPCDKNGVTIVVDFGDTADLEPIIRCAADFDGTGWDVFQATGIDVSGTSQYPIGFACRIENFPPISEQNCMDTPKYSEGSWGYFVYSEDSGWQVSQVGSANRNAQCGTAEGWLFIGPGKQDAGLMPKPIPRTVTCDG
jgi:hypothetical protein